jgi:hypothetical protein
MRFVVVQFVVTETDVEVWIRIVGVSLGLMQTDVFRAGTGTGIIQQAGFLKQDHQRLVRQAMVGNFHFVLKISRNTIFYFVDSRKLCYIIMKACALTTIFLYT